MGRSQNHCAKLVAPSGDESVDVEDVNDALSGGGGQSVSDVERFDHMPPATRKPLQEEANSLYHLFTHKPKRPIL